MKPKHLSLAIAALLAAGGLWFAAWRTHAFRESSTGTGSETPQARNSNMGAGIETPQDLEPSLGAGLKMPNGQPKPGQMPRPPELNLRFKDFTPEQRVEFARKGHGPGG